MNPSNAQPILVLQLAPGVELPLVYVPAGEFIMGEDKAHDPDAYDHEAPRHRVDLDEYWIGKYPVTVAQFTVFVHATGYRTWAEQCNLDLTWLNLEYSGSSVDSKRDHPVTYVSWEDAEAFCEWASRTTGQRVQLPSEAQWEKAARATDGRRYPWGNDAPITSSFQYQRYRWLNLPPAFCNFNDQIGDTTPVGAYSPHGDSPYGCADMAGNVWEWCADWYDSDYYRKSPERNPTGPTSGEYHVERGGECGDELGVRCAHRGWGTADDFLGGNFGFRVVVVRSDSLPTTGH